MSGWIINKIYSYICDACSAKFDITITKDSHIGGADVIYCPNCGEVEIRRDYKGEHVQLEFKGEGFYITDNKKGDM